jgi:putative membrane protein
MRVASEKGSTMGGYSMMAGMGWLGLLAMLLFWVGLIALVIWGVSNLLPIQRPAAQSDAVEIVRQRFARGEISREEYLQAVETLR